MIYDVCRPVLEDEVLGIEEKTDKLEELLSGEPTSLKGKALEDAVLGALWQWRSADDKTSSPPPVRGVNIVRTMSPAPWLQRTGTPVSAMRRLQQGESVALADGTVLHGPARKPGRKIAILGDTYDPSPIAGLAEGACLLVHEATNAHLPGVDPDTKAGDTYESVEARARSRGHSTPQMAGAFARRIGARKLVLNHFSARYAGNDDVDEEARRIMGAIRELAESTYGGEVVCARDLMSFDVGPRKE